jgi:hypothetical protein
MNGLPERPRLPVWQTIFLFALALLNLWVCFGELKQRHIVGFANGAVAILLLLLAVATGRRRQRA